MAEKTIESENMLSPINALAVSLFAYLRKLIRMPENISGTVYISFPAQYVPMIELTVYKISDKTLRR